MKQVILRSPYPKRIPISLARKLGYQHGAAVKWTSDVIDTKIGIYDALAYESYKTVGHKYETAYKISDRDERKYLRGFAAAISTKIGQQVYLIGEGGGNGHECYTVKSGPWPWRRNRRLRRKERRLRANRKKQRTRKVLAHFDWFNAEAKAIASQLAKSGIALNHYRTLEYRRIVIDMGAPKDAPRYRTGLGRSDAYAAALKLSLAGK